MTQAAILAASGSPGTTTGFKNRIINGNFFVNQYNAATVVTPVNGQYTIDRWNCYLSVASKYTAQQVSDAPAGFNYSIKYTSTSAYTAGSAEYFMNTQRIEGNNMADLGWGTSNAKAMTLSFWAKSSLTGTFGLCLQSSSNDVNYYTTYAISTANTWTYCTVTIPGPTSGTFPTDNTAGLILRWNLGTGTGLQVSTLNSWTSTTGYSPTGVVSIIAVNGATLQITGVQLEVGTTATNFDFRSYGTELALCQRYYEIASYNMVASGSLYASGSFKVEKRATPTFTILAQTSGSGGVIGTNSYQSTWGFVLDTFNSTFAQTKFSASAEL